MRFTVDTQTIPSCWKKPQTMVSFAEKKVAGIYEKDFRNLGILP